MKPFIVGCALGLLMSFTACGPQSITLKISNYTLACQQDTDCVAVAIDDVCAACHCPNASIAQSSKSKYDADVQAAQTACGPRPAIACAAACIQVVPRCVSNRCQTNS